MEDAAKLIQRVGADVFIFAQSVKLPGASATDHRKQSRHDHPYPDKLRVFLFDVIDNSP